MTSDLNKGKSITYNHLNLPARIEFGSSRSISYFYTADGPKRKMIVANGSSISTTDYVGGFVYENGLLNYFAHEEGRVLKTPAGFVVQYVVNDHLGNARATIQADANNRPVLMQYDSYYPFGSEIGGLSFVSSTENKYKYNGKEMQDAFNLNWYDYGARFYDPQLGRWHSPDPLATEFPSWSPYNYVMNNPIRLIDPDGRAPDDYYFKNNGVFVNKVETDNPDRFFVENSTKQSNKSNEKSCTENSQAELPKYDQIDLNSDLGVLARIGFAEFRGGNAVEMEAGLDVTQNRLKIGFRGATTMEEVVTQKLQYSSLNPSEANTNGKFYNDPLMMMNSSKTNESAFIKSMSAAIKVSNGFSGITDGALNYYSPRSMEPAGSKPSWHTSKSNVIDIPGARSSFITVIK